MDLMKEKNFVSLVAYLHNDSDRVTAFFQTMQKILQENFLKYEMIFVDDASEDDTVKKLRAAADGAKGGMIQIIRMSYFQGVEMAMNAGTDLSIGDFVFEFDSLTADYEPSLVMEVYRRSLEGYDIVSASPEGGQERKSAWFYRLYNHFSTNQYPLRTERFRILSRRAINRIHSMSKTIPYRKALYANCGLLQDTIQYVQHGGAHVKRDTETGKMRWRMGLDVLVIFTDMGYKVSSWMSLGMLVGSLLVGLYAVIYFYLGHPVAGWASMVCFLSLGFAGTFAVAAVIIKYLDVLIGLVFKKKGYTFSEIEKIAR